jgi:hypothetical protein
VLAVLLLMSTHMHVVKCIVLDFVAGISFLYVSKTSVFAS